jgi:S-adenosyl methyltransferase
VAEKAFAAMPTGRTAALENRAFLGRVVKFLAAEAGIRQFLDIGAGLPATVNPGLLTEGEGVGGQSG